MDPVKEMMAIQERMSRMLDEAFGWGRFGVRQGDVWDAAWRPNVDVVETPTEFVVRAELPGLAREDVEVEVDQRTLVLRGVKRYTREVDHERYLRMECGYGRFERSFTFPVELDPDHVEAKLRDGILTIHVPKLRAQTSRRIPVQD